MRLDPFPSHKSLVSVRALTAAVLAILAGLAPAVATANWNSAAVIWPQAGDGWSPNPAVEMASAYRELVQLAGVPADHIQTLGSPSAYGARLEKFSARLGEAARALDLSGSAELYVVLVGHAARLETDAEGNQLPYRWIAGPNRTVGPVYSSADLLGALKQTFPTGTPEWRNLRIHFVLDTCFAGNCLQDFQMNFIEFDFPRFTFLASSALNRMAGHSSGYEVMRWAFALERELRERSIEVCRDCSRFETVAKIFGVLATYFDFTRRGGQGYAYGRERDLRAWSPDEAAALLYLLPTLVTTDQGVWQSAHGLLNRISPEVLAERPELQVAPIQALAQVRNGLVAAAIDGYLRSPTTLAAESELGFVGYLIRVADDNPFVVHRSLRNALGFRRDQLLAMTGRGVRTCAAFFARR